MALTEDMARWLQRLPPAERLQILRTEQMMDEERTKAGDNHRRSGRRCSRCGKALHAGNPAPQCWRCRKGYKLPRETSQTEHNS